MDQQLAEILSAIEALTKRVDDLAEGQKTLVSKEEIQAFTAEIRALTERREQTVFRQRVEVVENKVNVLSLDVGTIRTELKEIQMVTTIVTETQDRLTTVEAELATSNAWFLQMELVVDRLIKESNRRENKFDASAPNFRSRKESLLFSASKMSRGSFKPWDIWGNNFSNSNISPEHHI